MEVVEANDRCPFLVGAEGLEQGKQIVDRFVLQFQNAKVKGLGGKVFDDVIHFSRPGTAPNAGGSQIGVRCSFEGFAGDRFGEKFEAAHFVGAVDTSFAASRHLFEQLPTKGSFAGSGRRPDYVKPRTEELLLVEVEEAGTTVGIGFHVRYFSVEVIGEEVGEGGFLGRNSRAADLVENSLRVGDNVGGRTNVFLGVVSEYLSGTNEFPQVGFLLNGLGMVFGVSRGERQVEQREQVAASDAFKVAGLLKLILNGEDVKRRASEVDAIDSAENNFVFGAVEVVRLKNGNDLGNNFALFQQQSGEQTFFHFDVVGKVQGRKAHDNHLVKKFFEEQKRRHSDECRRENTESLARKLALIYN